MNGVIIMDKPKGVTSFKALGIVKRALGTKKVGHTGTLDPDATGVLPILVGKATKAAELLSAADKEYEAKIKLGVRTDTLDLSGTVLEEREVKVSESDIISVIKSFEGDIMQLPPMYSAVSVGGRRLYDLARSGEEVERTERKVNIQSIEVTDISLPYVTFTVSCSKGTYIRTLADDIGEKLSTLAAVAELRRTRCGVFTLENAHTPEEIEKGALECMLPIDTLFEKYSRLDLDGRMSVLIKNGVPAYVSGQKDGEVLRLYDNVGEFIALAKVSPTDGRPSLKIIKGFY